MRKQSLRERNTKVVRGVNGRRGSLGGSMRIEPPGGAAGSPKSKGGAPKQERKQKERRGSVGNILLKQKPLGVATPAVGSIGEAPAADLSNMSSSGWDVMEDFLTAIRNISSEIRPDEAARTIIKETCQLLNADRSTLFFVDAEAQELILVIAKGANNIRIPIGNGLAGSAAASGKSINIDDAYQDARFSSAFDKASGYRTRAVLAVAVRDPAGNIVAVLQCINKVGGGTVFSSQDQILLEHMASHVGVVLRNAKLYESERSAKMKVASLLDVIKMLHSGASNTTSLIFTLSNRSNELVDADRCTLYLADQQREQLVVMQGDLDFRFPITKGIAGFCARSGKPVIIDDAYEDARFNKAMDVQSGYRTKAILCMPIFGKAGRGPKNVIGVLQLINKKDDTEMFHAQDLELMETLLNIAGPILESSKAFESKMSLQKPGKEIESVPRRSPRQPSRSKLVQPALTSFGEDEEEEDDW